MLFHLKKLEYWVLLRFVAKVARQMIPVRMQMMRAKSL